MLGIYFQFKFCLLTKSSLLSQIFDESLLIFNQINNIKLQKLNLKWFRVFESEYTDNKLNQVTPIIFYLWVWINILIQLCKYFKSFPSFFIWMNKAIKISTWFKCLSVSSHERLKQLKLSVNLNQYCIKYIDK